MWFPEASFPEVTKLAYLNRRKSLGGLAKEHDEKLGHSSLLEASNPSPDRDVWGDAYFFWCRAGLRCHHPHHQVEHHRLMVEEEHALAFPLSQTAGFTAKLFFHSC